MEDYYKRIIAVMESDSSDLEKEQKVTNILIEVKNKGVKKGQTKTIEAFKNYSSVLMEANFCQILPKMDY